MTTFSYEGYIVQRNGEGLAPATALSRVMLSISTPDQSPVLHYERTYTNGQPDDYIHLTSTIHSLQIGNEVFTPQEAMALDAETEQVSWFGGVSNILSIELGEGRTFMMQISGNPLPQMHSAQDYNGFLSGVTRIQLLNWGVFGPGVDIPLATIMNPTVSENDLIYGTDQSESIVAGPGSDTVYGGDGADTLNGGAGDDFLFGGDTAADLRDVIYGGDGHDHIDGGAGNDELHGGAGNDTILGDYGADRLIGNEGHDQLHGGAGSDEIHGGPGDDWINGGWGYDRLNGGTGADTFFHQGVANHGSDWIQDYRFAEGDVLAVGIAGATRDQFQVNFANTPNAGAADVAEAFVIYKPTQQILFALVDGAGQDGIVLRLAGQDFDLLA